MRNIIAKAAVVALSFNIVACSTNTQQQNTGVGAVTGAVVGGVAAGVIGSSPAVVVGSAIVGALVGGAIGHSMDSTDTAQTYSSLNGNTNKGTTWTNPKTGTTYTVVPTSAPFAYKGYNNCRRFHTTAVFANGKRHNYYGIACQKANGWVSVK